MLMILFLLQMTLLLKKILKISNRFNITKKKIVDEYVGFKLESREDVFIHNIHIFDEIIKTLKIK